MNSRQGKGKLHKKSWDKKNWNKRKNTLCNKCEGGNGTEGGNGKRLFRKLKNIIKQNNRKDR